MDSQVALLFRLCVFSKYGGRELAYRAGFFGDGRVPAVRRACAEKCWLGALWRPAVPRRGTPRKFWRSYWAGEGLWAYQEGQMGQKMVCFGSLRLTRSRQDESIEVGEVGSKRPSCFGVQWGACRLV